MPVPNTFANATTSIPLSQLDANFATAITLGNTAIQLGNTVSTLNNMTLANVTISSGTVSVANATVTGNVTMSGGNLSFTSTGQRITGDMSNATIANRLIVQTTTTNGGTTFSAIPNGTSQVGSFVAFNNSDPTNGSTVQMVVTSSESRFSAGAAGTGTYLPMTFHSNNAERMRLDTSGNVGIGTSLPASLLDLNKGSGAADIRLSVAGTLYGTMYASSSDMTINSITAIPLKFGTNNTERMQIDSSGNFLVGTSSTLFPSSHAFVNSGDAILGIRNSLSTAGKYWQLGPDANNTFKVYNQSSTGVFLSDGSTSWSSSSDERQKNIIEPISDATKKVASLRAVIGSYKSDETNKRRSFLIAQDVQQVLPEAVTETPDGFLGVAYSDVIPLLVAAIQELSAKVAALEAKQ